MEISSGFFYLDNHVVHNLCLLSHLDDCIPSSCLTELSRTSNTTLNTGDESRHSHFVPDLKRKVVSLLPLSTIALAFSQMLSNRWEIPLPFLVFWEFLSRTDVKFCISQVADKKQNPLKHTSIHTHYLWKTIHKGGWEEILAVGESLCLKPQTEGRISTSFPQTAWGNLWKWFAIHLAQRTPQNHANWEVPIFMLTLRTLLKLPRPSRVCMSEKTPSI